MEDQQEASVEASSNDQEALVQRLRALLPVLRSRGVRQLWLFGSRVRGEAMPDSDLDVLVEFEAPPSLIRFVELEYYISEQLGVKVDLVMRTALKPAIGRRILAEAVAV
ncbi:MAG: nucleotidyltransferase family protein [Chloroflexota bacterium]